MASRETSGGVTSAAVVVFAGSACVAFFGLALGAYLLFIRPLSAGRRALGPGGYAGVMLMLALPFCLLTAWGISTGVGLLRRKAWARVSVLAFSVLALLFVGFAALVLALAGRGMAEPGTDISETIRRGFWILALALVLVAIWWLVYFNLKSVREQFDEYPTTGHYSKLDRSAQTLFLEPHPPLSIVLIGGMYLLYVPVFIQLLVHDPPAILLGTVIRGPAATILYMLYLPVCIYVGIGLMKLWPAARIAAICVCLFHQLNSMVFVIAPGLDERLQDLVGGSGVVIPARILAKLAPLLWVGLVVGTALTVVILWALVTRKSAFERPAARPAGAGEGSA